MAFSIIGGADAKYLAATDILIGDMSNVNYEFLLYDRPVILLANDWVRNHFPEIGIKTDLHGLEAAIYRSLDNPREFEQKRDLWLKRTIHKPHQKGASKRYIDIMLENSGYQNPYFVLVHGNDTVRKTNIIPLAGELDLRNFNYIIADKLDQEIISRNKEVIVVAAHFKDLNDNLNGFNVHIDHDLKGKATANISYAIKDYKNNGYFPQINLHITPGEVGDRRTKYVLGPNSDRTVIGGYPKADDLLRLDNFQNKAEVYKELGFDLGIPLITYAPAGERSYMKPGGSLSEDVLVFLEDLSQKAIFHTLVKKKYDLNAVPGQNIKKLGRSLLDRYKSLLLEDCGPIWDELVSDFEEV